MSGNKEVNKPLTRFVDPLASDKTVFKIKPVKDGYLVQKFMKGKLTDATGNGTVFARQKDAVAYFVKTAKIGDLLR